MEDNIGTSMAQVSRLMRRRFDARARAIGVTRPQWQAIALLARHEGIKQGRLAELLEVEPITLGRMIDRLQDARIVERRPDPADRRAWLLFLTSRGQEQIERVRPFALEVLEAALEGVAAEERAQFLAILDRMRVNLSSRPPGQAFGEGPREAVVSG